MMTTVAVESSRFTEKFIKLAGDRTRAQLAVAAKVTPQALQRYFEGSAPRPHTALLLAKALDADPTWFVDEDQPWREDYPRWPTEPDNPAKLATDTQLLNEVALRFQLRAHWFNDLMDQLDAVDWDKVWAIVEAMQPGDALPEELEDVAFALRMRGHFPHTTPRSFNPEYMLKRDVGLGEIARIDPEKYDFLTLMERTIDQRRAQPKLELTLSRLSALNHIRGQEGEQSPDLVPDLSDLRKAD